MATIEEQLEAARKVSQVSEELPNPWQEHWSDTYNTPFFWNPETDESVWEKPLAEVRSAEGDDEVEESEESDDRGPSEEDGESEDLWEPPPPWRIYRSNRYNKQYYGNPETGESTWSWQDVFPWAPESDDREQSQEGEQKNGAGDGRGPPLRLPVERPSLTPPPRRDPPPPPPPPVKTRTLLGTPPCPAKRAFACRLK